MDEDHVTSVFFIYDCRIAEEIKLWKPDFVPKPCAKAKLSLKTKGSKPAYVLPW